MLVNDLVRITLLSDIPDENNFSFSHRYADFVGQTLKSTGVMGDE